MYPSTFLVISHPVISISDATVHYKVNTMWTHTIFLFLVTGTTLQDGGASFQERHRMMIPPKTESCFFLANMQEGYMINIRYLVMSSKNGQQLDITMRLRDNTGQMITYQVAMGSECLSNDSIMYTGQEDSWYL